MEDAKQVAQPPPAAGEQEQARREAEERKHLDEELDDALEMTFPASDPVAVSRPDPPFKKEEPPRDKTGRSKMSRIAGR